MTFESYLFGLQKILLDLKIFIHDKFGYRYDLIGLKIKINEIIINSNELVIDVYKVLISSLYRYKCIS